jgi:4-hydroxy-3-polyprenylbenzoate decarboxylase
MAKRVPINLREYLDLLKEYGEIKEINEEVDWNLEASAFATMSNRIGGPALLFNKLKGYPDGYKLVGSPYGGTRENTWKRLAIGMGLEPDCTYEEFSREIFMRFTHPIKPTVVSSGPCKEEIHIGKEASIFEFPIPYIHNGDGGRYGGTISSIITKDPNSDWVNWGNYRWMAHTKNKLGGDFQVGQHMPDMYYTAERAGEALPFCIAIGGPPASWIASCLAIPKGYSEADFVGGIMMQPVELVRAETNNLLVPAQAEVVIEGEIRPLERWDEGPFGEYDGFMNTPRRPQPVYRITAITHRKNPIYPFCAEGTRFNDSAAVPSSIYGGVLAGAMKFSGLPVTNMRCIPEGAWMGGVVLTDIKEKGQAGEIFDFLWSLPFLSWYHKLHVTDSQYDVLDTGDFLEDIGCFLRPDRLRYSDNIKNIANVAAWADVEDRKKGFCESVTLDITTHPGDEPKNRMRVEDMYGEEKLSKYEAKLNEIGVGKFQRKRIESLF